MGFFLAGGGRFKELVNSSFTLRVWGLLREGYIRRERERESQGGKNRSAQARRLRIISKSRTGEREKAQSEPARY